MEGTSTLTPGTDQFKACHGRAMLQMARLIPQALLSVSSPDLSRTLRRVLAASEDHLQKLAKNYGAPAGSCKDTTAGALEKQIIEVSRSHQSSGINDLAYTLLINKIIQHELLLRAAILKTISWERLVEVTVGE